MALRDAPILVLGAGGIGGTIAARLCARGAKVTLITRNPDIAHAIAGEGLRAQSHDGDIHIARPDAVPLVDDLDERHGPFGLCILAVPPSSAQTAVEDALPVLTADAPILCCPNGLIEERLSTIVDPERVVGGIVTFGASMLGPGKVEQTSKGGIMLGRLPNVQRDHDPMLDQLALLLHPALPIQRTDNLRGARWSKLAINCGVSSLGTVGGDRLGTLMRHRIVRRLMLEIITEVVEVAHAEDVDLIKIAHTIDLDWMALTPTERERTGSLMLTAKHSILLLTGLRYRNMRSSMLRALERGRTPPVDFLNGEITTRARRHPIDARVNATLQETIHKMAQGTMSPGLDALQHVWETTR